MSLHAFWYIYATDGENGFLLDLIRRPEEGVARLAVYSKDKPPDVLRKSLPSSDFVGGDDKLKVQLGPVELSPHGCRGTLDGICIDAAFSLSNREMTFAPLWLHKLFSQIPYFSSYYGTLEKGTCQGIPYRDLPLVYSTYRVGRISESVWILISALQFRDTDLAFEISAGRLFGMWGTSAYICFEGKEYKLNNPLTSFIRFKVHRAGEVIEQERIFSVSVRSGQISMEVTAKAPASDFAVLEQEGKTRIHTTLFGSCEASITLLGRGPTSKRYTFEAKRTCLLEVKDEF